LQGGCSCFGLGCFQCTCCRIDSTQKVFTAKGFCLIRPRLKTITAECQRGGPAVAQQPHKGTAEQLPLLGGRDQISMAAAKAGLPLPEAAGALGTAVEPGAAGSVEQGAVCL